MKYLEENKVLKGIEIKPDLIRFVRIPMYIYVGFYEDPCLYPNCVYTVPVILEYGT